MLVYLFCYLLTDADSKNIMTDELLQEIREEYWKNYIKQCVSKSDALFYHVVIWPHPLP